MAQPIQRVNLDLSATTLEELDQASQDLNVSRQAVIKTLVRQALDQHYLAGLSPHQNFFGHMLASRVSLH
jgi:metal-responsive CopG/Arc/MetJ family transcriptional regulator